MLFVVWFWIVVFYSYFFPKTFPSFFSFPFPFFALSVEFVSVGFCFCWVPFGFVLLGSHSQTQSVSVLLVYLLCWVLFWYLWFILFEERGLVGFVLLGFSWVCSVGFVNCTVSWGLCWILFSYVGYCLVRLFKHQSNMYVCKVWM